MLFDTIQTVFGAPIHQKAFRNWKGNGNLLSTVHANTFTFVWYVTYPNFFISCQLYPESFQAATRELQRIYGKEELNL